MSSSILHQCPFCGHISDISLSLAAFIENPHCVQCGLSVSESNGKLQDELSALFDRQMTMEQHHVSPPPPAQAQPVILSTTTPVQRPPISYSITQHYHHSSHVVPPPPAQSHPTDPLETLLVQAGINPNTLSPTQIELIKHADAEQQQRLIQTWQVYAVHGQSLDQSSNAQDIAMSDSMDEDKGSHAEPYMVSGYEALSGSASAPPPASSSTSAAKILPREPSTGEPYTVSTDPVYQSQQWWEIAPGSVESHYGLFEERNRYSRMHGCAGVQVPQWLCPN